MKSPSLIATALAAALICGIGSAAHAAIVIDGTRVIYPAKSREVSVRLSNRGDTPLVAQSWLDAGKPQVAPGEVATPFLLVPPLARIEPTRGQTLRLMLTQPPAVQDRESVYYLNVLEIPPKSDDSGGGNTLQLSLRSRIKVFLRPEGLPGSADDAPDALVWRVLRDGAARRLEVRNPSAYHVTLSKIALNAKPASGSVGSGMVAPRSTLSFALKQDPQDATRVEYSYIDDYGAEREHAKTLAP
jgi:P pilus assembly chaperone PapD